MTNLRNSQNHYGSVAKFLHWLIFLLVVCMLIAGFLLDGIQDKVTKSEIVNYHKLIGVSILTLMLLRLLWALVNPKPELPLGTPRWQHFAERGMHGLLYLVLIIMPLSGWIMSVAAGHLPHFFSYHLSLPFVPENKALSNTMFETHHAIAILIIVLVSIHILAALYHHFIKKDNVLKRMMPGG